MNWYLVLLLVTVDPKPGIISYTPPVATLLNQPYATQSACIADGPSKVDAARTAPGPALPLAANQKYTFTCVQV